MCQVCKFQCKQSASICIDKLWHYGKAYLYDKQIQIQIGLSVINRYCKVYVDFDFMQKEGKY